MQRTLIKSSRSCRRERGESVGIPLSLWQSLSQIKVRFGARENNSANARAQIPHARPSLDSEYLFGDPDLSLILLPPHPSNASRYIYICRSRISYPVWKRARGHVLGIILSKISKDPRTSDSFAILTHVHCRSLIRLWVSLTTVVISIIVEQGEVVAKGEVKTYNSDHSLSSNIF